MKAIPETCCGTKFDIYVCISEASFLIASSDGKDYVFVHVRFSYFVLLK